VDLKRSVTVLGSTGSIGTSTVDLLAANPDRFRVHALAGGAAHSDDRSRHAHDLWSMRKAWMNSGPGRSPLQVALASSGQPCWSVPMRRPGSCSSPEGQRS